MVINSVPDACFTPAKKNPNPQEVQTSREDKREVTCHEKDSKSYGDTESDDSTSLWGHRRVEKNSLNR